MPVGTASFPAAQGERLLLFGGCHGCQRFCSQLRDREAQHLSALRNHLAGTAGCELLVIEFFHDGLCLHTLKAGGAHQGRGADQPGKLVHGEKVFFHQAFRLHLGA